MGKLSPLVILLLSIDAVAAQKVQGNGRPLPQWLMGIIAVSCFLLVTFIGMLMKKILCEKSGRRVDGVESGEHTDMVMDEINGKNQDAFRRRRRSSEEEKGNDSGEEYDTNLDAIRGVTSAASRETEIDETYDSNLDVLRMARSAKSEENEKIYNTSLDVLRSKEEHVYVNHAMEGDDRATVM